MTGIDRSPFGRTIVPPGPDALIVPVALEATTFEPAEFDPVTRTRMRRPTSPEPSVYVFRVAPPTKAQSLPSALPPPEPQRTHWYANEIG